MAKNSSSGAVLRDEGNPEKRNANLKTPSSEQMNHVASVVAWLRGQEWVGEKPTRGQSADALEALCAQRDELASVLSDAVDKMLGNHPSIVKLRGRALAALKKLDTGTAQATECGTNETEGLRAELDELKAKNLARQQGILEDLRNI